MPPEVAAQQCHARALDRDVGAGAHGDADLGCRQRRRVVDAVAGHVATTRPSARSFATASALVLRQHFGLHRVDAEAARHPLRR